MLKIIRVETEAFHMKHWLAYFTFDFFEWDSNGLMQIGQLAIIIRQVMQLFHSVWAWLRDTQMKISIADNHAFI